MTALRDVFRREPIWLELLPRLVKAGLLPRLGSNVNTVYVEATPADTEYHLIKRLAESFPAASDAESLVEALRAIRLEFSSRKNRKALIVIDQFEQWLHANPETGGTELVNALRHCDGERVQSSGPGRGLRYKMCVEQHATNIAARASQYQGRTLRSTPVLSRILLDISSIEKLVVLT